MEKTWVYFPLVSKRLPLIIAAVVIVILIAAVLAFVLFKKSSKPEQETTVTPNTEEQSSETTSKGTIKSLIGLGKSLTCDVTYPTSDGQVNGTVYVADDKRMRGDFVITTKENKQMDSHMIQDAGLGYFWSSQAPQGTKMKIEENVPTPTPGTSQNVDVNSEVQYKCSDWSVDSSKFTPPANIQFMDMTQSMQQMQNQADKAKENTKSVCDQITDPQAKAACLSASGTNQ